MKNGWKGSAKGRLAFSPKLLLNNMQLQTWKAHPDDSHSGVSVPSREEGISPGRAGFNWRKLLFSEPLLKLDPQSCSWDRCPSLLESFLHKKRERKKKQLWHGEYSLYEPSGGIYFKLSLYSWKNPVRFVPLEICASWQGIKVNHYSSTHWIKLQRGTSLVAQWERIPAHARDMDSIFPWEGPTRCRVTKLTRHSYWAVLQSPGSTAPEPTRRKAVPRSTAPEPTRGKAVPQEPALCSERSQRKGEAIQRSQGVGPAHSS